MAALSEEGKGSAFGARHCSQALDVMVYFIPRQGGLGFGLREGCGQVGKAGSGPREGNRQGRTLAKGGRGRGDIRTQGREEGQG